MDDIVRLFNASIETFDQRVAGVADAWDAPTPCDEWNVRQLVNHVTVEDLWVPPLLAGKTITDVGDAFDGDQLGDDPLQGWARARDSSIAAARQDGATSVTTHLSYGDVPGEVYLSHVGADNVVHAWDLARAVGVDESLPGELIEFVIEAMGPVIEQARASGAYGDALEPPPGADRQTEMLALFGRRA